MRTGISVGEAMTQRPITVTPSTALKQCAKIMSDKNVGSLVVSEKNKFVGIITERDLVRKVLAKGIPAGQCKAKDVMEQNLITITPDKDIFDAITKMRDANIRHLPVVQDNKLLGLVTMKDVLKIEPDLFDILVQKFELREETHKPVFRQFAKEGACSSCGKYTSGLVYQDGTFVCEECKLPR